VSTHFPTLTAKDVARVLSRHGFVLVGQKGSHQKWRHPNGRQVIVPVHGSKPIPIGTLKSIIEGSGLRIEDFR
jgi:predicted RNA binding protein YcfA (HicA-like mRNA interferase family)